jgi:hypothetical protein
VVAEAAILEAVSAETRAPCRNAIAVSFPESNTSGSKSLSVMIRIPNPMARKMDIGSEVIDKSYSKLCDETGEPVSIIQCPMPSD